tara:strand:- start:347 stop:1015 length:669 start_codon:yes stop_codon:yes gene_type:complete
LYISNNSFEELDLRFRSNLINSIVGIKQASLVGTINSNNLTNLAIFSSVVHLGSNPALIGLFTRPITTPPKQTLNNIISEGSFTINHVNKNIISRSHCTAFKFSANESEFAECGLTEKFIENFRAPFVKESQASIGLNYIRHFDIKENGVIMIIGSLSHLIVNDDHVQKNGEVDMMLLDSIGVAGNNTYYEFLKHKSLNYIASNQRVLLNKIVKEEKSKSDS